jgi:hypothetical protein
LVFAARFERAVRAVPADEPLLIAYEGHGNAGEWSPYRTRRHDYPYADLIVALEGRIAPTLIVNDCCDSWSLAEVLRSSRTNSRRICAITSTHLTPCDSYDAHLLSRVIAAWRAGKPYAAGANLWFTVEGGSRRTAVGRPLPGPNLLTLWRALISNSQRLHRQRTARWGAVVDLHFVGTAS